jgi:hypothetical protein
MSSNPKPSKSFGATIFIPACANGSSVSRKSNQEKTRPPFGDRAEDQVFAMLTKEEKRTGASFTSENGVKPELPKGKHPGAGRLKSRPDVYRCVARRERRKRAGLSDYKGVLHLSNCRCWLNVFVHTDGSLGIRLEKIIDKPTPAKTQLDFHSPQNGSKPTSLPMNPEHKLPS